MKKFNKKREYMLKFEDTIFPEVKIFTAVEKEDNRGIKYKTYSTDDLINIQINFTLKEALIYNIPKKNTLYGIHFQNYPKKQQKLISLVSGAGIDYVIDLRSESKNYKKWISVEISGENKKQVLVPHGFGHLFMSTTDNVIMLFKIDELFDTQYSRTLSYKDPAIALDIMNSNFITSDKDLNAPFLADCNISFA